MFFHAFKYKIIYMTKDKEGLFWMICFPLIMAMFFYMAFSGIKDTPMSKVSVAVVGENAQLKTAMEESELFSLNYVSDAEAGSMLDQDKVSAIIYAEGNLSFVSSSDGYDIGLVKYFLDTYLSTSHTISNILASQPTLIKDGFLENLSFDKNYTKEKPINNNIDNIVVYFYSLIGMTIMMGGSLAIADVEHIKTNQSKTAARISVAPTKKRYLFGGSISATILFHFITILLEMLFLSKVLKIDFGDKAYLLIPLALIGCFSAVMLGALLSALIKKNSGLRTGCIIGYSIFGSFLAGMMSVEVKYFVNQYLPFIKYFNIPDLITDTLYSLYYYETNERYLLNLAILAAIGIAASIGTTALLRRQQYASI